MPSYALLSIPAYYILCIAPHAYAVSLASNSPSNTKTPSSASKPEPAWNNANPRSALTAQGLQKRLSPATFSRFERAEAAHKNNIENLPLFVAAVLASVLAEKVGSVGGVGGVAGVLGGKDVGTMTFVTGWFAARVLYTLLYINTATVEKSHARSMIFVAGTFWAFWQIWTAASALA